MSGQIITRALLERYLRATGWFIRVIGGVRWWRLGDDQILDAWLEPEKQWETANRIAFSLQCAPLEVGARLGALAAAEHNLDRARSHRAHPQSATYDLWVANILELEAEQILAMAGIALEQWEASREEGSPISREAGS